MWSWTYVSDRVDIRLKDLATKRDAIQNEMVTPQRKP